MKTQHTTRSYLVNLTAGETGTSRVWNARKPITVGHPIRWVLEHEQDGVRIRCLEEKSSLPKKAVEELFLKHSEIEKTASVCLAPGAHSSEGFHLELRPVASMEPVYAASAGNSLRVYFCKKDWAIESHLVGAELTARADGMKIVQLKGNPTGFYSAGDTIEIESMADGVRMGDEPLPRGEKRKVSFAKMPETVITHESSAWRFAHVSKSTAPDAFMAPGAADGESKLFHKVLKGAMVATVILGLLTWMVPSEKPLEVSKVRIVLNKKKTVKGYMTAAPKGDPRAKDFSIGKKGVAKNAGRKGTPGATKTAKVAPAGKQHPKLYSQEAAKGAKTQKVAKSSAAPKSSAPKSVTKPVSRPVSTSQTKVASANAKKSAVRTSQSSAVAAVPHSELFKTLSSASFRRTAKTVASGGVSGSAHSSDSYASARSMGASGGGTAAGAVGGAGGVSTRGGEIHGFGGGAGDGEGGPGSAGYGYGRGSYAKVSGQGRSFVSLDTGASDVEEGLTREQVGRVINSHMKEIRYCYDSAALRSPSIEGTMTMKFTVGAPGDVRTAGVGQSTTGDRRLHDCILSHLRQWKFPKPKGGVNVAVAYPLHFKSLAR
jgi:TonB family protein